MASRIIRLALVIGVLMTIIFAAGLGPLSAQTESDPAFENLLACVQERGSLSVVALFDESGSLKDSDPTHRRVDAAQVLLSGLRRLVDRGVEIDFYVAGFGDEFYDRGDSWRSVSVDDEGLGEIIESFRNPDRANKPDTDYVRALVGMVGAFDTLGGADTCRLAVWFTDGKYDIGSTTKRTEYEERIPEDELPSISHRKDTYEEIGKEWLCEDRDNIVDQLRGQEIFLFTVALAFDPLEEVLFTERVTQGVDSRGGTCGRDRSTDRQWGKFIQAQDVEDLIFLFDDLPSDLDEVTVILDDDDPTEGDSVSVFSFDVPFGTTELRILAATGSDEYTVTLTAPGGQTEAVAPGGEAFLLAESNVAPEWLTGAFSWRVIFDQRRRDWIGTWNVSIVGIDGARARVAVIGDLQIDAIPQANSVRVGDGTQVEFVVTNRAGTPATLEEADALSLSAVSIAPGSGVGKALTVVPSGSGSYIVDFLPTPGDADRSVEIQAAVTLTVNGIELPDLFESQTVTIQVLPIPTVPTIEMGPGIDLGTSTDGEVLGAESFLAVQGGNVDGCLSLLSADTTSLPEGTPSIGIEVTDERGRTLEIDDPVCSTLARTAPDSPGFIAADEQRTFSLIVTPADGGRGPASLEMNFVTSESIRDTRSAEVSLAVELELDKTPEPGPLWILLALFATLGLALPVLIVWLIGNLGAAFRPLEMYRYLWLRVVVHPDEKHVNLMRAGGEFPLSLVAPDEDEVRNLKPNTSRRGFPLNELRFSVKGGGLGGSYGSVTRTGGRVLGEITERGDYRSSRLPLDLHGVWVFSMADADTSDRIDVSRIPGLLVVFEDRRRRLSDTERDRLAQKIEERVGGEILYVVEAVASSTPSATPPPGHDDDGSADASYSSGSGWQDDEPVDLPGEAPSWDDPGSSGTDDRPPPTPDWST